MIDEPEITTTTRQEAAVIALKIPKDQIQHEMGPAIGEVIVTVSGQGVGPAGPVFSHHFRMDPEVWDFAVGVPVHAPVTSSGRVQPGELPAKRVARTTYRGPYEGLGEAWGEFHRWITQEELATAPDFWERYVSGPESGPDTAQSRTELVQPLA